MTFKLHHPLWTHLPALACIAISFGLLLSTRLPARVPTHFGRYGVPDSWGSPLDIWLMMIGLPLLLVIGSAVLDERYARHEQRRRFNWASLLDELAVGFLTGVFVKTIPQLSRPEPLLSGQIQMAHLFTAGAVVLAALLELLSKVLRWRSLAMETLQLSAEEETTTILARHGYLRAMAECGRSKARS